MISTFATIMRQLRGRKRKSQAKERVQSEVARLEAYSMRDTGATKLAGMLKANDYLVSLELPNCEIGHEGATAIASGIRRHGRLRELSLRYNPIGPLGAQAICRASRRNRNCGVHELCLHACSIGDEGAISLRKK